MNRTFEEIKPRNINSKSIKSIENKTIIKALNMYGRVPEQWELLQQIQELTNNWNELEKWLKEYMSKNEKWYTSELSTNDKQYYVNTYYTTNAVLMTMLDKMKEIKEGKNESK